MANVKITQLPAATSVTTDDLVPIVDVGTTTTQKATLSQILALAPTSTVNVTKGGTGTSTAFTQGSVVFAGASGVYSQDNANLFWDDTNDRLGIGGTPTTYKLEVAGSDALINGVRVGKGPSTNANVVIGTSTTLGSATSTTNCVAIGSNALAATAVGTDVVAIGTNALQSATSPNTSTAVGSNALAAHVSGIYNTAIGYFALSQATSTRNTALGANAGSNITTGGRCIVIGADASASAANALQEVTIGAANDVVTFRFGNPNNTAPNPGITATTITTRPAWNIGHNANSAAAPFATFLINGAIVGGIRQAAGGGTPLVYATSSDYRIKTDVQPIESPLTRLDALKPCRFHFTTNSGGPFVEGFIAHEVQAVVPQAVVGEKDAVDDEGKPDYQALDQAHLVPLLTAACQALRAHNQQLEARLAALEAAIAARP